MARVYVDVVAPDAPWTVDRAWIKQHVNDLVAHGDGCAQDRLECICIMVIPMGISHTVPDTPGISI